MKKKYLSNCELELQNDDYTVLRAFNCYDYFLRLSEFLDLFGKVTIISFEMA